MTTSDLRLPSRVQFSLPAPNAGHLDPNKQTEPQPRIGLPTLRPILRSSRRMSPSRCSIATGSPRTGFLFPETPPRGMAPTHPLSTFPKPLTRDALQHPPTLVATPTSFRRGRANALPL